MNAQTNEPGGNDDLSGALPELREGTLSEADLHAYSDDLRALAADIRCQVRREGAAPPASAPPAPPAPPDRVDLDEAIARARAGAAVQIQYDYAGARWRDTLMAAPGGHRLVRMRMTLNAS